MRKNHFHALLYQEFWDVLIDSGRFFLTVHEPFMPLLLVRPALQGRLWQSFADRERAPGPLPAMTALSQVADLGCDALVIDADSSHGVLAWCGQVPAGTTRCQNAHSIQRSVVCSRCCKVNCSTPSFAFSSEKSAGGRMDL